MPLVLADRVQETTTSTGTGTITLAGASVGFNSFSVIGNGNTTYYTIAGGSQWEIGVGTYTSSGTTLSRDTVLSSSNSNALVNFSAGVKTVFVTYPAERAVYEDASGGIASLSVTNANVTTLLTATNVSYSGTLTGGTGVVNIGSGQLYKDASGNVGIGTTSPNFSLQVNTTTANAARYVQITNGSTGATAGDGMLVGVDTSNEAIVWMQESSALKFATANTQRMRIDSSGMVLPAANNTYDLGSTSLRWRNIYTNDLHLSNGIGDYTVVEGEDELFLYNNKKGKVFKFSLIEVDPSEAPPKAKAD